MRKGFYLFDLLLVLLVIVFSWPGEEVWMEHRGAWWLLPVVFVPLLLRVGLNVMLYRRTAGATMATATFVVLFALSFRFGIGGYAGRGMFEVVLQGCDWLRGGGDGERMLPALDIHHYWRKAFLAALYGWLLLMPLVVWVRRSWTDRTTA